MDFLQAQSTLLSQLRTIYDDREAAIIVDWVMEKITGMKKIDRLLHKKTTLSLAAGITLQQYTDELMNGRPVQYVLQESWFAGMPFYVDEHVLIPRPETEELVEWIASDTPQPAASSQPFHILDVGTGSGCIAITLKKRIPHALVYGCDVSRDALAIASRNAAALQATVKLIEADFLDPRAWAALPSVQVLVSNPPYIPLRDKPSMAPHVVDFEPHLALFVTDQDPLIFYQALADFAQQKLLPGGAIFAETHEELAKATADLFRKAGFQSVVLIQDLQGKDRFIKATW